MSYQTHQKRWKTTVRIVVIYSLFGLAWIYGSDTVFGWLVNDPKVLFKIAVVKGSLFILCTSSLLYFLINRFVQKVSSAESRQIESLKSYESIFNATNEAIFVHDALSGSILDINDRMLEIYGYKRDEALAADIGCLSGGMPPYSEAEAIENIRKAMIEGPQVFEWLSRKKSGELFWSEISLKRFSALDYDRVIAVVRDISDRRRFDEELRKSEEKNRTVLNSAMDGFWLVSQHGRLLEANEAYSRMSGYTVQELQTMTIADLDVHETTDDASAHNKKILEKREDRFVTQHRRKDGTVFDVEVSAKYIPFDGGLYVGFLRNITERREAEESLRMRESYYRSLFDSSLIGVTVTGSNFMITDANAAFCKMLDYSKEELIGKLSFADISHPDDSDISIDMVRKLMGHEIEHYTLEKRYVSKTGKTVPAMIYVRGVYNHDGEYEGSTASILDITERELAEKERIKNEQRLTCLFNISQYPFTSEQEFLNHALQEVIRLTDSKIGYIYFYSEQKRQFTLNTWSHDVMKECSVMEKQTIYDLDSTGIWGEAVRQRQPILLNDFQDHHPLKKGVPEGHVLLKRFLTIPVFRDEEIVAVVGVANKESNYNDTDKLQLTLFMDSVWKITSRKRTEDENRMLELKLLHAQRMESLGVLAGGIAHDFNNILAIIIGHCSLAEMHKEKAVEDHIPKIERAANRAAELCSQMLSYAGKATLVQTQVNMLMLVNDMVTMLKATIKQNVAISFDRPAEILFVKGDAAQIRQVVMNLIINASEAIGEVQGEVSVSLTHTAVDAGHSVKDYHGDTITPGLYVCLEVTDTGCGMADETQRRIFEPFFTTKFTGRGLGMSAVLGIISAHNGALQLTSQPNKGTSFKVFIPVQSNGSAGEESVDHISKEPWHGSGTVLLVEDEEQVKLIAKTILEIIGFSVIEASNGKEALELYQKNATDITLVLTDMGMPVMDGYEMIRELKKLNPKLPIVISSGFGDADVSSRIASDDIAGLISKPYHPNQLREVLKNVVERTQPTYA